MVQIIAGEKGKGKTKILLDKVNAEVKDAKGSIIYIDANVKHMYDLNSKVRLIAIGDYAIESKEAFVGFILGIISQNHDIQTIYLDSFRHVASIKDEEIEEVVSALEVISNKYEVNFVLCIGVNADALTEETKKYITVSL
jgi:hypothetical protein